MILDGQEVPNPGERVLVRLPTAIVDCQMESVEQKIDRNGNLHWWVTCKDFTGKRVKVGLARIQTEREQEILF